MFTSSSADIIFYNFVELSLTSEKTFVANFPFLKDSTNLPPPPPHPPLHLPPNKSPRCFSLLICQLLTEYTTKLRRI